MTADEINQLFDAMKNADYETIFNFADIEIESEDKEDYFDNNVDGILRKLMAKIENGEYNYFSTLVKEDSDTKDIYLSLMSFSTKIDDIKDLIDSAEELGIGRYHIRNLIIATGNVDGYLEDLQRLKELGLNRL